MVSPLALDSQLYSSLETPESPYSSLIAKLSSFADKLLLRISFILSDEFSVTPPCSSILLISSSETTGSKKEVDVSTSELCSILFSKFSPPTLVVAIPPLNSLSFDCTSPSL